MPRVKRGITTHKRHHRMLKAASGFRGGRRRLIRSAKDTLIRAMRYSYRDRRVRKREIRQLWITRINAAARAEGITYSRLTAALKSSGIEVNRKVLSEMAIHDAEGFRQLVATAKAAQSAN